MKKHLTYLVIVIIVLSTSIPIAAQSSDGEIKTGKLLKRKTENGVDNYAYATYSFKFAGNGPEIQNLCLNDWDLLFGNGPSQDTFEVSMIVDDRSRIKDLGRHSWGDRLKIPTLSAYEEPEREPAVKAIEGHVYMVHSRDTDTDLYVLFRVEKHVPGESVEITWKLIPPPNRL